MYFLCFLPLLTLLLVSLSQKRSNFCLSKVTSFFIQAAGLAYHHRTACGAYHQPLWGCISSRVSVHPPAAWWYTMLCIDDIPQLVADDIHAYGVIGMRDFGMHLNPLEKYDIIHLKRWYEIKKVNILQLIASICLLIGSIINLLNLLIEIPFALYVCTGPLLLTSVILFGIVIVKQIKKGKNKKK